MTKQIFDSGNRSTLFVAYFHVDNALTIDPGNETALKYGCKVSFKLKEWQKLHRYSGSWVKHHPNDSLGYAFRAIAHKETGNLGLSLKDHDKSIELDENNSYALFNRGIVKELTGDDFGASIDYGKAVQLNSDFAAAKDALVQVRKQIANSGGKQRLGWANDSGSFRKTYGNKTPAKKYSTAIKPEKIKSLNSNLNRTKNLIAIESGKINSKQSRIREIDNQIRRLRSMRRARNILDDLEREEQDRNEIKIDQLESERKRLQSQIGASQSSKQNLTQEKEQIQSEINDMEKSLSEAIRKRIDSAGQGDHR